MTTIIQNIERSQLREGLPSFAPGDRVRVHFQVIEGSRRRTQVFEGVVIRRQGSGLRETFTVRKQSFGVGVERTFPLHSPKIERLEIAARGDVRRAKLYYLRGRIGKAARVTERRWGMDEDLVGASVAAGSAEAVETPDGAEAAAPAEAPEAAPVEPEGDAAVSEEPAGESEPTSEAEANAEDTAEPAQPEGEQADESAGEADESSG